MPISAGLFFSGWYRRQCARSAGTWDYMATAFSRDQLLAAFDEIGHAAVSVRVHLDIAVYGGSALMLASNFRFATEDVDIAEIDRPWPDWLAAAVAGIAHWPDDWLNEAVTSHLSPLGQIRLAISLFWAVSRADLSMWA
jgi:hypothetical protein